MRAEKAYCSRNVPCVLLAYLKSTWLSDWAAAQTPHPPKPKEAIALSKIRNGYAAESKLSEAERAEKNAKEKAEKIRLACREGRICFELFARYTGKILHGSRRIRKLV